MPRSNSSARSSPTSCAVPSSARPPPAASARMATYPTSRGCGSISIAAISGVCDGSSTGSTKRKTWLPSPHPALASRAPTSPLRGEANAELKVQSAQAVHTQRERDFTSVVNIVLGHVPDDPSARANGLLSRSVGSWSGEFRLEVGGRPPCQARRHQRPAVFERPHQNGRLARGHLLEVVPALVLIPLGTAITHPVVKTPLAGGDYVAHEHPDRPQPFSCRETKLRSVERSDRSH